MIFGTVDFLVQWLVRNIAKADRRETVKLSKGLSAPIDAVSAIQPTSAPIKETITILLIEIDETPVRNPPRPCNKLLKIQNQELADSFKTFIVLKMFVTLNNRSYSARYAENSLSYERRKATLCTL